MLQKPSELPEQTRFCPKDQEIALFYEGSSSDIAFQQVQRHIADCQYCQYLIGMLGRLETDGSDTEVPGHLLASAKQMGRDSNSRNIPNNIPSNIHRLPAFAAAAVVVLALSILMGSQLQNSRESQPLPTVGLTGDTGIRQLRSVDQRSVDQPGPKPRILTPVEGALVSPDDLVIKWTETPGSLYYDLYIMSDEGDLILEQRVNATQWSASQAGIFTGGVEYYARVEARLSDSRSVSTDHVLFKVEGQ